MTVTHPPESLAVVVIGILDDQHGAGSRPAPTPGGTGKTIGRAEYLLEAMTGGPDGC